MKKCMVFIAAALLVTGISGAEAVRAKDYRIHGIEGGSLPPAGGKSYYQYQWGLKNNGDFSGKRIKSGSGLGPGESGRIRVDGPGSQEQEAEESVVRGFAGADIRIEQAWDYYEQCPERRQVVVAMIDTGVDTGHPELAGCIWVNGKEIPGDGIDNDNNGYVDDINGWNFYSDNNQVFNGAEDEHGTHGAGTIAAAWDGQGTSGIADGSYVKIMVLKVLGSQDGKGVSSGVKKAVRYAQDNGAQICNLSMGTLTRDAQLEDIIRNSPMLFVVSAGNGDGAGRGYSIDDLPMYPASCTADNIITVGSLLFDGTLDASSNYGGVGVDIAAPGMSILSCVPGGYAFMSGTSMAAPMVTGTAALVYSCRPDLDIMGVKQAILHSARPGEGMEGKTVTGGILDAYGAVTYGR